MTARRKRFYIIRHGETELNKNGIVQGRGVNADLNDTGRKQASAFYQMYKDYPFDKIYTSTLKRTHQTVDGFIKKNIPWEQLSGLDELAWGKYEGQTSTPELREAFKKLLAAWGAGHYDVKVEGGESPAEVYERQKEAFNYILSKEAEDEILICMHGRAMRLLMCYLMNRKLCFMDEYPHQNTSLYVLDYENKEFKIVEFNSLKHLEVL